MIYSYERVSTTNQDERRQELAFNNVKIDKKYLYKISGKTKDRPELNKLMLDVSHGVHIYCESISRLGRNVDDLRYLCNCFKDKGVIVHFIKEGFYTEGDMYKFLLTIIGAVADLEFNYLKTLLSTIKSGNQKR